MGDGWSSGCCAKCMIAFSANNQWVKGQTYNGCDRHYNPPEFMFEEGEIWFGEMIELCRDCHVELHREIKKILNQVANTLKFCNSEYYVWMRMSTNQRLEARQRVYDYTKKWVDNNGNTNS